MKDLTIFIKECEDYLKNSKEKDANHLFSRSETFSAAQRKPIETMIASIKKANGEEKQTEEAVNNAFKALKELFIDVMRDSTFTKYKGMVTHRGIDTTNQTTISRSVDNGGGTAGMRMIYAFKAAIKAKQVNYDYFKSSDPGDRKDPLRLAFNSNDGL